MGPVLAACARMPPSLRCRALCDLVDAAPAGPRGSGGGARPVAAAALLELGASAEAGRAVSRRVAAAVAGRAAAWERAWAPAAGDAARLWLGEARVRMVAAGAPAGPAAEADVADAAPPRPGGAGGVRPWHAGWSAAALAGGAPAAGDDVAAAAAALGEVSAACCRALELSRHAAGPRGGGAPPLAPAEARWALSCAAGCFLADAAAASCDALGVVDAAADEPPLVALARRVAAGDVAAAAGHPLGGADAAAHARRLAVAAAARGAAGRPLSYDALAARLGLSVGGADADEAVEAAVADAVGLGLCRARLDQRARTALLDGASPAVVDRAELEALRGRVRGWRDALRLAPEAAVEAARRMELGAGLRGGSAAAPGGAA